MELVVKLNKWANSHTNIGVDILRLGFGAFIFYKGMYFMTTSNYLVSVMQPLDYDAATMFVAHYVAPAHLCGGLFIAIGLLTRIAAIVQLPVLAGAILVNFFGNMDATNLTQASVAFLLCLFFVIYGSGKHSVDYSMKLNL
jgi:putative oxidoreductase